MLAKGYAEQKNYDKAAQYYRRAMHHGSVAVAASYELARVYTLAGEYDSAYDVLTKLLKEDTENGKLISALAYVCAMKGEFEQALDLYEKLRQRNLLELSSSKNYSALLYVAKKWETALEIVRPIQLLYPEDNDLMRVEVLSLLQLEIAKTTNEETQSNDTLLGSTEKKILSSNDKTQLSSVDRAQMSPIVRAQTYLSIQGNSQDVDVLALLGKDYEVQELYLKALETYEAIPVEKRSQDVLLSVATICLTKTNDSTKGLGYLEDALKLGYRKQDEFTKKCGKLSSENLSKVSELFFNYKANDAVKKDEN